MKKQSFLQGAMILAIAGVISRVLGAVYRIPLTRIIGDEGIGLYQIAYPVYTTVLTVSTIGINVAISKLVAEHLARGRPDMAHRVFRISLVLMGGLGLLFSVLMFLGARGIAEGIAHNPAAYYAIVALAPAIFVVSLVSSLRGYFQGQQIMTPTAVSQVVEQLVRVAIVLFLAYYLLPGGVALAAGGATFGAAVGGVAALLVLLVIYWRHRAETAALVRGGKATGGPPTTSVVASILRLALPISLGGIVVPLMNLIDLVVVPSRLIGLGYTFAEATRLYGHLTGMALTLVNMPTVVTYALQASLVPAVSEAQAVGDRVAIRSRAAAGIRITLLMAIPAVAGLYLLATPIADLLFGFPEAGVPIAAMSAGLLFLTLQQATSGVLQGLGRTDLPVRNLLVGAIVKLVTSWVLTGIPAFGIRGAALGTAAGFMVAASLNLAAVKNLTGAGISIREGVLKPVIATALMGLATVALYRQGLSLLGRNGPATLLAIAGGIGVYGMVLLLLGGLRERDFELLPGVGPRLMRWLRSLGVLRR
ncbi:MAG: polysaccharide biosynthesis protein [bacterium]|nr:polysaccharide biosynthesis protein [bacterium]